MSYKCPECSNQTRFSRIDTDLVASQWLISGNGEAIDKVSSTHLETVEYGTDITCLECDISRSETEFDEDLQEDEDADHDSV